MTEVIAGQPVTLLAQFYDFAGGSLTDLDATPTITVTSVADGSTALSATSSGVTHPSTGSYGYTWTPGSGLTPCLYLATWSGLKSSAPVTATEEITVVALGDSADTNTAQDGYWYATREEVKAELDVKETARSNARIDRAIEDASRRIDGAMHRTFAPVTATRYFDWPARPSTGYTPWILRLNDSELIGVTAMSSGGRTITSGQYNLEPNRSGPPYNRVEINLSTSAAYGGGATYQRDVTITGLWGYRDTETPTGATVEALDASETLVDVDGATSAAAGVGSILRIDSERMIVTERRQLDTGQTVTTTALAAQANNVTITVGSGAAFTAGETILIDSERILIEDIAGNNLTVRRAWDGSTIAAHSVGTAIYAPRTLAVTRGALGTTADSHGNASTVYVWRPPGGIRQLCVAEAITDLLQGRSGYARTAGAGENEREASGRGLNDLRASTYQTYGRKARHRGV